MNLYVLLSLVVLVASYEVKDSVIHLEGSDLENINTLFNKVFVFYYVPWCEHCEKLGPIYDQLAKVLEEEGSPIKVAKINCDEHQQTYDFAQIRQFPLLKYYTAKEEIEFDGDRTLSYLHKWLTKRIKFPIKTLEKHQLQMLRTTPSSQVYVVYHGSIVTARAAQFISMAYNDNYNHYCNVEESGQSEGTLEILRSFDKDIIELVEPLQTQRWIRRHDRPAVVPLDERSISHVFRNGDKGVFFFIDPLHAKVQQQYRKTAEEWKRRPSSKLELTFLAIPEEHEDYFGLMQYLSLHALDRPLAVVDGRKETKYILNASISNISSQVIIKFLEDIENNKIQSEPLQTFVPNEEMYHEFIHMNDTKTGQFSQEAQNTAFGSNQQVERDQRPTFLKKETSFLLTREL